MQAEEMELSYQLKTRAPHGLRPHGRSKLEGSICWEREHQDHSSPWSLGEKKGP